MKNIKIVRKVALMLLLTFMITKTIQSQTAPGFDDDAVQDAPIDGGISLLIFAGTAYGLMKNKQRSGPRQKQNK